MIPDFINVNFSCSTNGMGIWSRKIKRIRIEKLELRKNKSLRVYFNTFDWDNSRDGIIYSDPQWLSDLKKQLAIFFNRAPESLGLYYSEQGLQSQNYVHLDADPSFITIWYKHFIKQNPALYLTHQLKYVRDYARKRIEKFDRKLKNKLPEKEIQ